MPHPAQRLDTVTQGDQRACEVLDVGDGVKTIGTAQHLGRLTGEARANTRCPTDDSWASGPKKSESLPIAARTRPTSWRP
jgi:hypothetical protein